ncbi:MAG: lipoyl synthase [Chloroflexi bacterium]|nr:lipoyl synthase [Chloroflexota bacterium]
MDNPSPGAGGRTGRPAAQRLPPWFKVRRPGAPNYIRLKALLRDAELHTVCEEAKCPNIGDCWGYGTATFLILGDTCTRRCGYCAIQSGRPHTLDVLEPDRVARAVQRLGLRHAVVTSVARDDLSDGGASVFAATIRRIRARCPETRVEVLIPDFKGSAEALETVLRARPDVLNHNIETVPRLYRQVRPGGRYARSLELLARAKDLVPDLVTKSGLMVGLGESWEEVEEVLRDLRAVACDVLTVGQYLQPSPAHLPIARFWPPEAFAQLREQALALGFRHVEAGPLVRSSYRAHEHAVPADGAPRPA